MLSIFLFIYIPLPYFPIFQQCNKHDQKIDSHLGLRMLVPWTGNEKREFGLSCFCSFHFSPSYCLHDPTPAPPVQPHCLQWPKCGTDASVSCEWFSPSVPCLSCSLSRSQDPGKGGRKPKPDLLCPPTGGALHLCG